MNSFTDIKIHSNIRTAGDHRGTQVQNFTYRYSCHLDSLFINFIFIFGFISCHITYFYIVYRNVPQHTRLALALGYSLQNVPLLLLSLRLSSMPLPYLPSPSRPPLPLPLSLSFISVLTPPQAYVGLFGFILMTLVIGFKRFLFAIPFNVFMFCGITGFIFAYYIDEAVSYLQIGGSEEKR